MSLGANRGSQTIPKWVLQNMNMIKSLLRPSSPTCGFLLLSQKSVKLPKSTKKQKQTPFSCENTAAQMAPFIIWGLNQAGAIDDPGAHWNPFMLKIKKIFMLMVLMRLAPPTGSLCSGSYMRKTTLFCPLNKEPRADKI